METKKIKIIHYGLGPIGIATAKLVLTKSDMEIVGAVDIDREIVGKDLGEILGCKPPPGDSSHGQRREALRHGAGRRRYPYGRIPSQAGLRTIGGNHPGGEEPRILGGGTPLPHTGKTPSWRQRSMPWPWRSELTVLGTGVNPGFVMDALPLALTGVLPGGP